MSRFDQGLVLALLFCSPVLAQVDRASLTGTVTDASGAAIPDSTVTVETALTGFRRERASTSNAGTYQMPGLVVGTYTVSAAKTGFQTVRTENVVLGVGQTRTLDVSLAVGAITTAVEVSAAVTPLEQTNAEIGTVIAEQQMQNIPLNGRHWASLMMLAPGAVNVGKGTRTRSGSSDGRETTTTGPLTVSTRPASRTHGRKAICGW